MVPLAPAALCQRLQSLDLKLKGYAFQAVREYKDCVYN